MQKKFIGLLLSFLFLWNTGADSLAANVTFKDLPTDHWAYTEITRAASYGIMNGREDGTMNPDGALTWAHYLAMIVRTFAPLAYQGAVYSGMTWQMAGYQTARDRGYLLPDDFLNVSESTLDHAIARQDVAVLLSRVLQTADTASAPVSGYDPISNGNGDYYTHSRTDENLYTAYVSIWDMFWADFFADGYDDDDFDDTESEPDNTVTETEPTITADIALSDFGQMERDYQQAVRRLYDLGIIRGKTDGSFGPYDTIRRCDGAVLLMRTLDVMDRLRDGERVSLTLDLVNADGKVVADPITAEGRINQSLYSLAQIYAPINYKAISQTGSVSVASSHYSLQFAPLTQSEIEEREATEQYRRGEITYEEYMQKDFWLHKAGHNSRKDALIYGEETTDTVPVQNPGEEDIGTTENTGNTAIRYDTAEESASHMTTVEVPVWRLRGNNKIPATLSIRINNAIADELVQIFTEIYNDPEQFPVSDVGGYSWRENNSRSEHILGTAVDINVDANYCVRDGVATAGTHWTPGEDPYSITPGGSVVRVFAEHGWRWGGNAWSGHTDQTYGYHDYMHFSFFGT